MRLHTNSDCKNENNLNRFPESTFYYISQKDNIEEAYCKNNLIIFILDGTIQITSYYFNDQHIKSNTMLCIPKGFSYRIKSSKGTRLLFFYFETFNNWYTKQGLCFSQKLIIEQQYKGTAIHINQSLREYLKSLDIYLQVNANYCTYLHEIKTEELFFNLHWFYTKEDLAKLLFPIIKNTGSFRRFVIDNCDKVNNVSELIKQSNISKSVFYTKFKKEFGIPAKKWMLNRLKDKILYRIADPEITPKDLMREFNFSSPEHLNSFCKKQFGMSPTLLIQSQTTLITD